MRRIFMILMAVALLCSLAFGVSAATAATQVTYQASASLDESCEVALTATIHLDEPVKDLSFPVPSSASNITLNGSRVGSSVSGEGRYVDISGITAGLAGDFSFGITYHLDDIIDTNDNGFLEMQLPLLAGFAYPVEKMSFTVTMPGEITSKPAFTSGYHQASIEQDMVFSYEGNTVTGASVRPMKDRETLLMTLPVSEEMYPQAVIQLHDFDAYYLLMGIFGGLALLYWLIFLRNLPPRFVTVTAPPEGYCAGQLGSLIRLQGADLTTMIFTWAQLGYLVIRIDKRDRVMLYKQMEMGNERSAFERRWFQLLFENRNFTDTSSFRYTMLCQKLALQTSQLQGLVHPKSGSKPVFRGLVTLVGVFCGICLGLTLTMEAAVQWFPTMLIAIYCGAASWLIQLWADDLFSQHKTKIFLAILLAAGWLTLSIIAKTTALDGWIIAAMFLAGLMASFGGRRTEPGRQLMSEALGFRRYMCTIPRAQLHHIRLKNPDYFHDLAPYALALGCDKAFAHRFGKDMVPPCPYIQGVPQKPMAATEWCEYLRRTANLMESRLRQMPMERATNFIRSLTR